MNTTLGTPRKGTGRQGSKADEGAESGAHGISCCEEGPGSEPRLMAMCPIAGICSGMMNRGAWSGWLTLLPGALLIAVGLVVILVPQALAWLVGGTAIFMGLMFFMMAHWMRPVCGGDGITPGGADGADRMTSSNARAGAPHRPGPPTGLRFVSVSWNRTGNAGCSSWTPSSKPDRRCEVPRGAAGPTERVDRRSRGDP